MNQYPLGTDVELTFTFTNPDETPYNPDWVKAHVLRPDQETKDIIDATLLGSGRAVAIYSPPVVGLYVYRGVTPDDVTTLERAFVVVSRVDG